MPTISKQEMHDLRSSLGSIMMASEVLAMTSAESAALEILQRHTRSMLLILTPSDDVADDAVIIALRTSGKAERFDTPPGA